MEVGTRLWVHSTFGQYLVWHFAERTEFGEWQLKCNGACLKDDALVSLNGIVGPKCEACLEAAVSLKLAEETGVPSPSWYTWIGCPACESVWASRSSNPNIVLTGPRLYRECPFCHSRVASVVLGGCGEDLKPLLRVLSKGRTTNHA